ncbi:MAG: rhomboid family intramembrane serine protease [Bacteroidales bacterium]|nr:rhomboid family intramembrane serine protease [Bacteroidales bacterium]MCD8385378.1 rhomboid family intramembrane serine protease [Bacteroidales bacterium]
MTTRIITVNSVMWAVIAGATIFVKPADFEWWVGLFALPESITELPYRVWTLGTYMFSQHDFLHLLVNMLWLLLFGRMIEQAVGGQRLLQIYIQGGLAGAAAFLIANVINLGPHPFMIGASCSVLAVIGAATALMPKWRVNLLVLGSVRVLWIAVAAVVLFIIIEPSLYVSIAHAAGLCTGLGYGLVKARGGLKRVLGIRHITMPQQYSEVSMEIGSDEDKLDRLLEKVSRSGYASLSSRERQMLFDLSQKIKR